MRLLCGRSVDIRLALNAGNLDLRRKWAARPRPSANYYKSIATPTFISLPPHGTAF